MFLANATCASKTQCPNTHVHNHIYCESNTCISKTKKKQRQAQRRNLLMEPRHVQSYRRTYRNQSHAAFPSHVIGVTIWWGIDMCMDLMEGTGMDKH